MCRTWITEVVEVTAAKPGLKSIPIRVCVCVCVYVSSKLDEGANAIDCRALYQLGEHQTPGALLKVYPV